MNEEQAADVASPLARSWPLHELLWKLQLSTMYHLKRERFLDGADRAGKAFSTLMGAAAFAQLKADNQVGFYATMLVTIVSTLSLVYGPSSKARKHAELARDYKKLESEIALKGEDIKASDLNQFKSKYLILEASEPAALGALVTHCHNELSTAYGFDKHVTKLPFWQRWFKNLIDFDQTITRRRRKRFYILRCGWFPLFVWVRRNK